MEMVEAKDSYQKFLKTNKDIYVTTKLGRRIRGTNYARGYKHEPMEEFIDRSLLNLKN